MYDGSEILRIELANWNVTQLIQFDAIKILRKCIPIFLTLSENRYLRFFSLIFTAF